MITKPPHFLLFSEATRRASFGENRAPSDSGDGDSHTHASGYWHFALRSPDGQTNLEVTDQERDASEERLVLIGVVRGLEALDQPSRVTLVSTSEVVHRGLRFGLDDWRANRWKWERFGKMTPVKNADLWRRIDRAMNFHDIDCRVIRRNPPADDLTRPVPTVQNSAGLGCRAARDPANVASGERRAVPFKRFDAPRGIGIGRMVRHLFGW